MAHLIPIGNSLGVRLPKLFIQQAGLAGVPLELRVTSEGLLIAPVRPVRADWADAAQKIARHHDDVLILGDGDTTCVDDEEWDWNAP